MKKNTFSHQLRHIRMLANLTQNEMAAKLEVNVRRFQKWEYGERRPESLIEREMLIRAKRLIQAEHS